MKGSILIFGGNKQARKNYIEEMLEELKIAESSREADLLIIGLEEKTSIGIEKSREVIKFVANKPFSGDNKVVVIHDAEKLTVQAQNALLKTLEETPDYLSIILNSNTENDLLDTVISRCRRIKVADIQAELDNENNFENFIKMEIGERFDWAENIAKLDRNNIIEMLNLWVLQARNLGYYNKIDIIEGIKSDLANTNVNARMGLETLSLNC